MGCVPLSGVGLATCAGGTGTELLSPRCYGAVLHRTAVAQAVVPAGSQSISGTHAGVGIQGFNLQHGVFVLSFLKWFGGNPGSAAGSLMHSKQWAL